MKTMRMSHCPSEQGFQVQGFQVQGFPVHGFQAEVEVPEVSYFKLTLYRIFSIKYNIIIMLIL
jgi:hypothetical protein